MALFLLGQARQGPGDASIGGNLFEPTLYDPQNNPIIRRPEAARHYPPNVANRLWRASRGRNFLKPAFRHKCNKTTVRRPERNAAREFGTGERMGVQSVQRTNPQPVASICSSAIENQPMAVR